MSYSFTSQVTHVEANLNTKIIIKNTYKLIVNELRETWKQSHYQDDENRLLDEVLPVVLEKVTRENESATGGSKGKGGNATAKKQKP